MPRAFRPFLRADVLAFGLLASAGLALLSVGCGGPNFSAAYDSPLVGQPAPAIELNDLNGNRVSLSDHLGKDVVVLDFWATWCPPCRQAMPTIVSVAQQFSGRGVVLYAVNLGESPGEIRRFLDDTRLDVDVLLDTDKAVGIAYQANEIPQTVIIDKDGTVQAVHVGFGPATGDEITAQLDALVAGEKLAQVAVPMSSQR